MHIYYIDSVSGDNRNAGTTPQYPKKDWSDLSLLPGDTVYLKRGCQWSMSISSPDGAPGNPIIWDAYGEGDAPQIKGCIRLLPDCWREISPFIWEYTKELPSEPGNLIINDATAYGTLRWSMDELQSQGDWYDTGIGKTELPKIPRSHSDRFYLFSKGNPGMVYDKLECALFADRRLVTAKQHAVIRNLSFYGGAVHGFAVDDGHDIRIENCSFFAIGGLVWNKDLHIRFGNAIEFWDGCQNVIVKNCTFDQIYDTCFTHQGSIPFEIPDHICVSQCRFRNYGMAAYELREYIPRHAEFIDNICENAGCGFAMQGEELPRKSEIWPQPMGHHLFLWKITEATPEGSVLIARNQFGASPNGSAVYSIISPEAEKQLLFRDNHYTDQTSIYMGGAYQSV